MHSSFPQFSTLPLFPLFRFSDTCSLTGNHDGKSNVMGIVSGDTFSLRACYDQGNPLALSTLLAFANSWNNNYRLSTAYITEKQGVCVQSDLQMSKYAKANMHLIKEFVRTFLSTNTMFHYKWFQTYLMAHTDKGK